MHYLIQKHMNHLSYFETDNSIIYVLSARCTLIRPSNSASKEDRQVLPDIETVGADIIDCRDTKVTFEWTIRSSVGDAESR